MVDISNQEQCKINFKPRFKLRTIICGFCQHEKTCEQPCDVFNYLKDEVNDG